MMKAAIHSMVWASAHEHVYIPPPGLQLQQYRFLDGVNQGRSEMHKHWFRASRLDT